jgi:hypothetical protein
MLTGISKSMFSSILVDEIIVKGCSESSALFITRDSNSSTTLLATNAIQ